MRVLRHCTCRRRCHEKPGLWRVRVRRSSCRVRPGRRHPLDPQQLSDRQGKQMGQHRDIAATVAANAIDKARRAKAEAVAVKWEHDTSFRKMAHLCLATAVVLDVAFWAAIAYWLPGSMSWPEAFAAAFGSCLVVVGVGYLAIEFITTD